MASSKPAAAAGDAGRKAVDWEAVERDYRTGALSSREIGARHGCSHVAINKRAKVSSWTRDLKAKIQEKADALVTKAAVTREVTSSKLVSERELVEANAEAISQVRLGHRKDIGRARRLVQAFLGELEQTTDNGDLFNQLGDMLRSEDDRGKDARNDIYMKVIGLTGRVTNLKALSESLKNLVALERQAWGLDEPVKPPDDPSVLSDDELDAKISARIAVASTGAAVQVH